MNQPSLFDKCFKNSEQIITLSQPPNLPVIVGLVTLVLAGLLPPGFAQATVSLISFGALFTWAWLELFMGVNYFRRALGLLVMGFLIYNRL